MFRSSRCGGINRLAPSNCPAAKLGLSFFFLGYHSLEDEYFERMTFSGMNYALSESNKSRKQKNITPVNNALCHLRLLMRL